MLLQQRLIKLLQGKGMIAALCPSTGRQVLMVLTDFVPKITRDTRFYRLFPLVLYLSKIILSLIWCVPCFLSIFFPLLFFLFFLFGFFSLSLRFFLLLNFLFSVIFFYFSVGVFLFGIVLSLFFSFLFSYFFWCCLSFSFFLCCLFFFLSTFYFSFCFLHFAFCFFAFCCCLFSFFLHFAFCFFRARSLFFYYPRLREDGLNRELRRALLFTKPLPCDVIPLHIASRCIFDPI